MLKLATHVLGVATYVEGLEHKFALDLSTAIESLESKFEAKFEAFKAELTTGDTAANEAVDALGVKVAALTASMPAVAATV